MSANDRWLDLVREIRKGAVALDRSQLVRGMFIDRYYEAVHPVTHKIGRGDGYSIFFGECRIGWWSSRAEVCGVVEIFSDAIKDYPVDVGTGDA